MLFSVRFYIQMTCKHKQTEKNVINEGESFAIHSLYGVTKQILKIYVLYGMTEQENLSCFVAWHSGQYHGANAGSERQTKFKTRMTKTNLFSVI